VPLPGDLTEQEQEDAELIDEDDEAELMSQLFEHLESGEEESDDEDCSEEFDDDEDDEDDDDADDDEEEDDLEEEEEEDDDVQERGFAFFGMGGRALAKQLARHPKLSSCKHEPMLHPAAQLLNLSSAAVNAKHCLSSVGTHCNLISYLLLCCWCAIVIARQFHVPRMLHLWHCCKSLHASPLDMRNLSHCATSYNSMHQLATATLTHLVADRMRPSTAAVQDDHMS